MSSPKIKHGYYNTFYAFKLFEPDIKDREYNNLINLLSKSSLVISTETPSKEVRFNDQFSNILEERRNIYIKHKADKNILPKYLKESFREISDKPTVQIIPGPTSIEVIAHDNFEDDLYYSQHITLAQLAAIYSSEEQYTGLPAKDTKNRFALLPPFISKNNKYFYPSMFLTIFKHGYATIHYSMEIENFSFDEINESAWNLKFDTIFLPGILNDGDPNEMKKNAKTLNIFALLDIYAKCIQQFTISRNALENGHHFHNLVLTDFAFMPKNFEDKLSPNYLENMYKLLFAPIEQHQLRSASDTQSIINNRFYSFSKTHLIYANNNRSLSVFSKEFKDAIKLGSKDFDDAEILNDPYSLNMMTQNSNLGGIITAVELILLKKLATQQVSVFELTEDTSLRKLLNILIKENIDYSIDFSKYFFVYGSVRDLIYFLEEKCEDFLLLNLMNERREKIEKVISLKKEKDIARFTALGPFLTIIFTLLFSFPALDGILKSFKQEEHLNSIYVLLNIISIILVLYFYKTRIKEFYQDISNEHLPKLSYKISIYQVKYYITSYNFLEFLNKDYKTAIKELSLYLKGKNISKQ